jgi:hydrocephalus-inducing protein
MEATWTVTFSPDSTDSVTASLVVVTEREKFLVPLIGKGAAAALELPDSVAFQPTPAKRPAQQPLLVRNVGQKAGTFTFSASGAFGVEPRQAQLAPGETLQLAISFTPPAAQAYQGELEVRWQLPCILRGRQGGGGGVSSWRPVAPT